MKSAHCVLILFCICWLAYLFLGHKFGLVSHAAHWDHVLIQHGGPEFKFSVFPTIPASNPSILLAHMLGGSKKRLKQLGSCRPHGKPGSGSPNLNLNWPLGGEAGDVSFQCLISVSLKGSFFKEISLFKSEDCLSKTEHSSWLICLCSLESQNLKSLFYLVKIKAERRAPKEFYHRPIQLIHLRLINLEGYMLYFLDFEGEIRYFLYPQSTYLTQKMCCGIKTIITKVKTVILVFAIPFLSFYRTAVFFSPFLLSTLNLGYSPNWLGWRKMPLSHSYITSIQTDLRAPLEQNQLDSLQLFMGSVS